MDEQSTDLEKASSAGRRLMFSRLDETRELLGLGSIPDWALKAGVSHQAIYAAQAGTLTLSFDTIEELKAALPVPTAVRRADEDLYWTHDVALIVGQADAVLTAFRLAWITGNFLSHKQDGKVLSKEAHDVAARLLLEFMHIVKLLDVVIDLYRSKDFRKGAQRLARVFALNNIYNGCLALKREARASLNRIGDTMELSKPLPAELAEALHLLLDNPDSGFNAASWGALESVSELLDRTAAFADFMTARAPVQGGVAA